MREPTIFEQVVERVYQAGCPKKATWKIPLWLKDDVLGAETHKGNKFVTYHDRQYFMLGYPVEFVEGDGLITLEVSMGVNIHRHEWREKYITLDGIDCFSGLECDCGLILTPDALAALANFQPNHDVITQFAIPQRRTGPSEHK